MTSKTQKSDQFQTLERYKTINLTTFRKNGEAVTTPVWFFAEGDKIYVRSESDSGKIKRIRNNGHVQVAASTFGGKALGLPMDAEAHLILDVELKQRAIKGLNRRYLPEQIIMFPNYVPDTAVSTVTKQGKCCYGSDPNYP